jgi:hypothetical protein
MRSLGSDKRVLGSVFDVAHKLNAVLVFAFVARISKDFLASLSKESSQQCFRRWCWHEEEAFPDHIQAATSSLISSTRPISVSQLKSLQPIPIFRRLNRNCL